MKKIVTSSLLLLACVLAFAPAGRGQQAPAWQAAVATPGVINAGGRTGSGSEVTATATDASGNVYIAGGYFGNLTLGNLTLASSSSTGYPPDAFVAKWLPASGTFAWALRVGTVPRTTTAPGGILPLNSVVEKIVVSGTSVYLGGSFAEPGAVFGNLTLTNAGGTGGTRDGFVAKLTDAGSSASFGWVQQVGGTGTDGIVGLAVSGTSVYAAGAFSGTASGFGTTSLTSAGGTDIFVTKLVDAGTTATTSWSQRFGGTGDDAAENLAVTGTTLYLAGLFANTSTFGSATFTSTGGTDGFVTKLTDAGSTVGVAWTQRVGSTGNDDVVDVAVEGSNLYLTGYFANSLAAGPATLVSAGGSDGFVAKLTDAGSTSTFAWSQRVGGPNEDAGYRIAVRGGKVYLAGLFASTGNATSSYATFGGITLQSVGGADGFVAKFIDSGTASSFVWVQQAGSATDDVVLGLALGATSVYVGGWFSGPRMVLGSQTLTNPATGGSVSDGFLATLPDLALPTRDPVLQAGLRLYPNPAHGQVVVRVPAAGAAVATLVLTDALGRVVRRHQLPTGLDYVLDLASLAPGVYAAQVRAGTALAVQRLVVE